MCCTLCFGLEYDYDQNVIYNTSNVEFKGILLLHIKCCYTPVIPCSSIEEQTELCGACFRDGPREMRGWAALGVNLNI